MPKISISYGEMSIEATLPEGSHILTMPLTHPLTNPEQQIREALQKPIGCGPLEQIAAFKLNLALAEGRLPTACIVVSDNTRPVPYNGSNGILMPVLQVLQRVGFSFENICILIACGTHCPMSEKEIEAMVGTNLFRLGVQFVCHDASDESQLICVGKTKRGNLVSVNKRYVQADLKILTGLVESHFMAGASGGRKSICPGIMGREGTLIFHGPELMAHPKAKDLVLEGNPVHQEALEAARLAEADFLVNVVLNSHFAITGVFCGQMEQAHNAAVEKLRAEVEIPIPSSYHLVITHGGYVARNHYQAAKCGVSALDAVKKHGYMLILANNHDPQPVGSSPYQDMLSLLKRVGPKTFQALLVSKDWVFQPDQWQVQKWAELMAHLEKNGLVYFAPQLNDYHFTCIPGQNGHQFLPQPLPPISNAIEMVVQKSVGYFLARAGADLESVRKGKFRIAYLQDGPYGIPRLAP